MEGFAIRPADAGDIPLLMRFIRELAQYEHLLDEVVATEALLREWLFEKAKAEALIGEAEGIPVAFALFFHNFSTFLGRSGVYLEDLFVIPQERGKGYGKAMLRHLAGLAVERGCGRMEWSCLDWNEKSISLYLSLGAVKMSDWTVYRVAGEALRGLAGQGVVGTGA